MILGLQNLGNAFFSFLREDKSEIYRCVPRRILRKNNHLGTVVKKLGVIWFELGLFCPRWDRVHGMAHSGGQFT